MASVFNQVKIYLSRAGLVPQQQYEVHTDVRVAIDALDYEYNNDARTQSARLSAARLQLAVGGRGLGPTEGEQRTQRASFVPTYHTRVHTEQQLALGSDALLKKTPRECLGTALRGQIRV